MALDKYRYTIYPDRIYVIEIDKNVKIELRGSEIMSQLGLESYLYTQDSPETSQDMPEDN